MKDWFKALSASLLATHHGDPEQTRRARVLAILLLGLLAATLLMTFLQLTGLLSTGLTASASNDLILDVAVCLGLAALLQLNRRGHISLVSHLFLLGISAAVTLIEVRQPGRVDLLYVVPTVAASFL